MNDTMTKAQEVIDRLLEVLPDEISGEMSLSDWGDPYGSLMGWWFALNDAAMTCDLPTDESFRPSPFGPDDEAWEYDILLTIIAETDPTPDDVVAWHKAFSTAYHALQMLPDICY